MTIDEQVARLMVTMPSESMAKKVKLLRSALQEVARDQRLACAQAVLQMPSIDGTGTLRKNAVHQAVMNTPAP